MKQKIRAGSLPISILLVLTLCISAIGFALQTENSYASTSSKRSKVIKIAKSYLGHYGTYCDVFVRKVYTKAHIKGASKISGGCRAEMVKLKKYKVKKPKKGDIIIYHYGHAAIYAGKGKMIMSTGCGGKVVVRGVNNSFFKHYSRSYYRLIR